MAVGDSGLSKLRVRVAEAAARFDRLRLPAPGPLGSPDPETGERWSVRNVMGHMAEALPFWTDQVRQVLAGAEQTGRGEAGYVGRREGIEAKSKETEEQLRGRMSAAIDGVSRVLATLKDSDLDREFLHRSRTGDRRMRLGEFIDQLLVGHLEEHVEQISEISR